AYLVRAIAGERVGVRVLLRPGASPHAYEPSMADARLAAGAALYLAVGHPRLGSEAAWLSALESGGSGEGGSGPGIERLAEGCDVQPDDPHVWLSVPCYGLMARRAEAALRDLLPAADGPGLRAGLDSLLATVARTASRADSILGPDRGRAFLVYHPAWGYLAREHGLEQVPVQSGSREPSPAELARVVARVRQEDLHVMFVQPGTSRGEARRVAAELGVETSSMDPLAEDWPAMYLDAVRALDASWRR
ncbi:MAG TPA: zinc ABC transporter substrate-binding protein, partial [Gemmatimonadota bacterium]|nr:zinc ABC transporter substrate-binding protein [Gemmatimonadota bacterium]